MKEFTNHRECDERYRLAGACLSLTLALQPASSMGSALIDPTTFAGTYSAAATRCSETDEKGTSTPCAASDYLTIDAIDSKSARVRLHSRQANGHECEVDGVAHVERNHLVLPAEARPDTSVRPLLVIEVREKAFHLSLRDAPDWPDPFCGSRATVKGLVFSREDFASRDSSNITPSFDCRRARTRAEKTICRYPALAALDRRVSDAYRQALKVDFDKPQLKRDQQVWLRRRDFLSCGEKAECQLALHLERLEELGSRPLCRDLQARLARSRSEDLEWPNQPEGGHGRRYVGLDVDSDGVADDVAWECGAQECNLFVKSSTGGDWHADTSYPASILVFRSRVMVIVGKGRDVHPLEGKRNSRSVSEIRGNTLHSLCPAL